MSPASPLRCVEPASRLGAAAAATVTAQGWNKRSKIYKWDVIDFKYGIMDILVYEFLLQLGCGRYVCKNCKWDMGGM